MKKLILLAMILSAVVATADPTPPVSIQSILRAAPKVTNPSGATRVIMMDGGSIRQQSYTSLKYVLPIASPTTLGGFKVGTGLSIDGSGVLNNTGIAGVASFKGRGGAVLPAANDYSIAQISGAATVATTGSYNDLSNKPTIPAAQVSSDWNAASGVAQILNKPSIPTTLSQLSQDSTHRTVTDAEKVGWNSNSSPVQSVFGRTGAVVKQAGDYTASDVGADALGSATSVQVNLDSHTGNTNNPHSVTKAQIGLSLVSNVDATARASHTGTQSADTITDGTTNKTFTAAEKTKLAGVATGATANSTDAALRDRSSHTGAQAISTVTGLQTALDGKEPADSTILKDADIGVTVMSPSGSQASTTGVGGDVQTALDLKANTVDLDTAAFTASTAYATAAQGGKIDGAVFHLSDYASLQAATDAATAAGGGTVLNAKGATINITATFVPKNNVRVDLNGGTLKWTGGASGVMVENDITTYGAKHSGIVNGHLDPGANVVTVFKFHSIRSSYYGGLNLRSGNNNLVFMHLLADAQAGDPSDATRNTNDNEFGPFSSEGVTNVPVIKQALILEGFNDGGAWRGVTVNQFTGPWKFFVKEKGYSFRQYCDSNKFTGRHTITLAHATVPGTCVVFNDSATPDQAIDVWGEHIDHLSCEAWYPALAGQKAVEINHAGGITIDYLGNDRVAQETWPDGMVTDNYSQGHRITYVEGSPTYLVKEYIKGEFLVQGTGNGVTFPDATQVRGMTGSATNAASATGTPSNGCAQWSSGNLVSTGSACGASEGGTGDVVGPASATTGNVAIFSDTTGKLLADAGGPPAFAPATNSADYLPQWNGTNSKLLKNGYPVGSSGGASTVLMTNSLGGTTLKTSDSSNLQFTVQNDSSTTDRFPGVTIRNHYGTGTGFPALTLDNRGGDATTATATGSGKKLGVVVANGYGDNAGKNGGSITFSTTGAFTNANQPTKMVVALGSTGGNNSLTDRLTILDTGATTLAGNLAVTGTITASSNLQATKIGAGVNPAYALDIYDSTVLGSTLNNNVLLSQIQGYTNTNLLKSRSWIVRDTDASTSWDKTTWHDALSVDGAFATPRTDTRTWYERDPSGETFAWGSQATTSMTLTKAGLLTLAGSVKAAQFTETVLAPAAGSTFSPAGVAESVYKYSCNASPCTVNLPTTGLPAGGVTLNFRIVPTGAHSVTWAGGTRYAIGTHQSTMVSGVPNYYSAYTTDQGATWDIFFASYGTAL